MSILLFLCVTFLDAVHIPQQQQQEYDHSNSTSRESSELAQLDTVLRRTKAQWSRSLATLAIVLSQKVGVDKACQGIRVLGKVQYVLRLLDVAKQLRLASWTEVKLYLVDVLSGSGSVEGGSGGSAIGGDGAYEVLFDDNLLLMEVMGAGR